MKDHIPPEDLSILQHSAMLKPGIKLSLVQCRIPELMLKAVQAKMRKDGLSWRQLFRWAALKYLATEDRDQAVKIWRKCV